MPNNCLSVLYKHIIQVENKNVWLKVCVWGGGGGGHKHTIALQSKRWGAHAPLQKIINIRKDCIVRP